MAFFKTVFIFRAGANGWSELWYQQISEIQNGVSPAKNVAAKRQALLGTGCQLEAIRISSVDRPFKSYIFTVSLDWNSEATEADTAWNTIYARVDDVSKVYHRIMQLRGLPDDWIIRTPLSHEFGPVWNGNMVAALNQYCASLKQNGFLFKARDQAGAGGTEITVSAFGKEAGTNRLTASAVGVAAGPGQKVTFRDVTGFGAKTYSAGRQEVISNDGTTLVLKTVIPADVLPASWSTGKVRLYSAAYIGPDVCTILRVSHRDTGRRFFVTRGRRSARKASPSTPAG